jgi:ABC-type transport system involved in cytochrome bd biosynthesis fused ATPase/permease subunit
MINGTDLRRVDRSALQQSVAWVGQEPTLVRGSVADNVRLGLPTASDAQVRRALFAAGVDLDPDRRVDEGIGLSAGELRRVALARAWLRIRYSMGRLMLLDEPTAGLDDGTELDAIAMIKDLGVTAIVVSHRPAVLAAADHVVSIGDPA